MLKYNGGDAILYFNDSKIIFNTLFEKPSIYFQLVFGLNNTNEIPIALNTYVNAMGFWRDTAAYMIVRINAIIQLFSFGNYFAHTITICFISFLGQLQIYKFIKRSLTSKQSYLYLLFPIFLLPSTLFWTSGVHKEAFIIFSFGFILNNYALLFSSNKKIINRLIILLLSLSLLLLLRPYLCYLIIPALIALYLCKFVEKNYWLLFTTIYTLYFLLSAIVYYSLTDYSLLHLLQLKQMQFSNLVGNSNIEPIYTDTWYKMLIQIPFALFNSLFRPMFYEAKGWLQWIIAIENIIIFILFIYVCIATKFKTFWKQKNQILILFYCLSVLIIIGLVVPNLGAINRYKSVVLPLLYSVIAIYFPIKKA